MSQNKSNSNSCINKELSLRSRYVCFMTEESKDRLDMFIDIVDLMTIFLGDMAENKDADVVAARRMRSLFQVFSEELERIESGLLFPKGTFSEYQAVNGLNIIKRYGANKAEALLQDSD
ncbi:hypothetical protein LU604_21315 [Erwinia tracheiphila]|uniref:Uncharacterized protein n=1 Tax=Erwinia tracheiphila TaxID=65700 RepID=A0A345CY31_9GAMM|nr:hypothetical protein [Erwinia tracheiphila]AXF78348.1 hypothetical protein AV903_23830 [Erwinia tracheiphila]UIA82922.1 hypothetical protein LU604_21315 [Erwinia tracheiphila]